MNFNNLIKYEYHPHDLEKNLPVEFSKLKDEIVEDIKSSNILEQKFIVIEHIIISINQNSHQGDFTYEIKTALQSSTPNINYNSSLEGKNYLQLIRQSIHDLTRFVLAKKEELDSKSK